MECIATAASEYIWEGGAEGEKGGEKDGCGRMNRKEGEDG